MIAFYISAENSKKTNVVQTPVVQIPVVKTQVKVQAQVPTLEDGCRLYRIYHRLKDFLQLR
jgi:hypothetical protein